MWWVDGQLWLANNQCVMIVLYHMLLFIKAKWSFSLICAYSSKQTYINYSIEIYCLHAIPDMVLMMLFVVLKRQKSSFAFIYLFLNKSSEFTQTKKENPIVPIISRYSQVICISGWCFQNNNAILLPLSWDIY